MQSSSFAKSTSETLYEAFLLITSTFSIGFVAIIVTTLLLLSVFFEHTGKFTQFLHRLAFAYLIYYIWLEGMGIVFRFDLVSSDAYLELSQEDSIFFRLFLVYSTITVAIFLFGVAERFFRTQKSILEFSIMVFCIHVGGLFALRLHTFMDILLALEIVTLASYALITFERQNRFSTYAGVQYFILGSLPSAFLILSFGLFYLQGGSIAIQDLDLIFNTFYTSSDFLQVNDAINFLWLSPIDVKVTGVELLPATNWINYSENNFVRDFRSISEIESILTSINPISFIPLIALFFLLFNFLFKLTAAPFHVWAPSVYGKAPVATVAFLSIYSKVIIFFLLFKFISTYLHIYSFFTMYFLIFVGLITILTGMIGSFTEKVIKRFFIYSSMGHVGFRLIGFALNTLEGSIASFHYLAVYVLSSFVIWFFLLTIGINKNHLSHFMDVKNTDPVLALIFAFLVFSMSGIPPLGGFFIKLDVLAAVLDTSHFFINYVLFFFTVASFFYYLRLIKILFFDEQSNQNIPINFSTYYTIEKPYHEGRIWIMSLIIIVLSVYCLLVQKPLLVIQSEMIASLY